MSWEPIDGDARDTPEVEDEDNDPESVGVAAECSSDGVEGPEDPANPPGVTGVAIAIPGVLGDVADVPGVPGTDSVMLGVVDCVG